MSGGSGVKRGPCIGWSTDGDVFGALVDTVGAFIDFFHNLRLGIGVCVFIFTLIPWGADDVDVNSEAK